MQTVYKQDARALPILSDHRRQFLIDLKIYIQDRQEQGDLFIVGMVLNDSVQGHGHTQFFRELHMKETILMIHSGTSLPVTTIRNTLNYLLDGI